MTGLSGRPLALASRLALLGGARAFETRGTCGPTFAESLCEFGPLSSWESKFRDSLAEVGSTECSLTWREVATPAGRSMSRLAPSMLPTDAAASSGSLWRSPAASEPGTRTDGLTDANGRPWRPGRTAYDSRGRNCQVGLQQEMRAFWPTPVARAFEENPETFRERNSALSHSRAKGTSGRPLGVAMMAQWPTPTVADVTGGRRARGGSRGDELLLNGLMLGRTGRTQSGFRARTVARGAPNPAFACWLMGWPDEVTCGAWRAIASFRKSRRRQSER